MPGPNIRDSSSLTKATLERRSAATQGTRGVVFDIQRFAIHDGPGIRTLVFLKGCPLRCWWCQNPEGLSSKKSLWYFEYRCIQSKRCIPICPTNALSFNTAGLVIDHSACNECALCVEACPSGALSIAGREIDAEELVREVEKDVLLFDNSGGGVTFSGGEPLFQPAFLKEVLVLCRERGIHTALETSGQASARTFESIIDSVDLFLFDLKIVDERDHEKYTGVSNRVIKKNLRTLTERRGRDVILRFPVITGINDTEKHVEEFQSFARGLRGISEVDLLPYHDVSEKYRRLGLTYRMGAHVAPSAEKLDHIREKLEEIGLKVKIGG
ncbi:MAG TPA: glycyl-radical enzyme activating protein [Nitrososphaerales archaeon]|nr:glycyl-radical enzyme activating protein [Nitrososphaerales archaeon]